MGFNATKARRRDMGPPIKGRVDRGAMPHGSRGSLLLPENRYALQQFKPAYPGSPAVRPISTHSRPTERQSIFLDIPACSLEKHRAVGKTLSSWSNRAVCQQELDLPRLQRRHRETHPAAFPDPEKIGYRQVVHRNTR